MALWTRRSEQKSEGEVIHSYLWWMESLSAGLQKLGLDRNAADRGGLYAAFRAEGYTNREAMDSVNRILPLKEDEP